MKNLSFVKMEISTFSNIDLNFTWQQKKNFVFDETNRNEIDLLNKSI